MASSKDIAFGLNQLGRIDLIQGFYTEAKQHLQESLAISTHLAHRAAQANSLACLGGAVNGLGEFDQAKAFYEQSLQIYRELDDQPNI
ncbi:MAG: tetratricopeptide repeat protein, partial [Chloroflexota bacterium]